MPSAGAQRWGFSILYECVIGNAWREHGGNGAVLRQRQLDRPLNVGGVDALTRDHVFQVDRREHLRVLLRVSAVIQTS